MKHMSFFVFLLLLTNIYANPSQNNIYQLIFGGQHSEAVQILTEQLEADSLNVENHYLLGLSWFYQKEYRQALPYFQNTIELDTLHVNSLYYLANTQMQLGQTKDTEKSFLRAVQIDSSRMEIKDALGQCYYKNHKFDQAYSVYKDLVAMHPHSVFYYLMLARSASKCDSLNLAVQYYRNAFTLDTLNSKVSFELSGTLLKMDSLDASLVFINNALDGQPQNWQFHRLKADILYKQKKFMAAILSYLDAITFGDNTVAALKKLGFCYYSESLYEKCINALEQVLENDDTDPVVYYYIGLCFKALEEYDLAIQYFGDSIDNVFPQFMDEIYIALAECHYLESDHEHAIQSYKEALKYSSEKEVIYYHLANIYDDIYADKQVALQYFEKAGQKEITPEITQYIQQRMSEIKEKIFLKE